MPGLLERIEAGQVLVADGALGTMLLDRGLGPGECPEAWNLTRPHVLEEIARLYVEAGADFVTANTFGASPLKLAHYGLDGRMEEINRAGVATVRRAVGDRALVAASCGPCGQILKPYGDADPETVYDSFRRQMDVLIEAGADLICVETMVDPAEAVLAVRAAKDASPRTPVTATMTFDATPRGFFTIMGTTVEQAAARLVDAGADVVGSNCGNGIENMIAVAKLFRGATDRPLLIQSNAGLPEAKDGRLVYNEGPDFMAKKARELLAAGVSVIGGCCGTTPDHIRALRQVVNHAAAG